LISARAQEWKQTGLAAPAKPISMHEGGFLQKLMEVAGGDRNKPIAIICATGGRTRYLQHALAGAGFVPTSSTCPRAWMGSPAGPGWLKRGLPVKPFAAAVTRHQRRTGIGRQRVSRKPKLRAKPMPDQISNATKANL
jgi:rhodanese-related sulfurtransferase